MDADCFRLNRGCFAVILSIAQFYMGFELFLSEKYLFGKKGILFFRLKSLTGKGFYRFCP